MAAPITPAPITATLTALAGLKYQPNANYNNLIAGPDGGTPEKPVGTVWVAVDLNGEVHAVRAILPGDRSEIRYRAAQLALDRLRRAFDRDQDAVGWTSRG